MDQNAIYAMNELAEQLKANSPALAQLAQYMPILEMNVLSQVCANNQLSDDVRNIAAARLEDVIKSTYSNQYDNSVDSLFK